MIRVPTQEIQLAQYSGVVPEGLISGITSAAKKLQGMRIVHVNATPVGGGVAEILQSLVPLMCSVGIEAEWYVIEPDDAFFRVGKTLHHCLQGDGESLSHDDIALYLKHNEKSANAAAAVGLTADLWLIHDAQVLPLLHYLNAPPGVWVCHVDATRPNTIIMEFLRSYMSNYKMIMASMPEYLPEDNNADRVFVSPPAIDPLIPKHRLLGSDQAREVLAGLGIDPGRPLVAQVSRFDRWKDPWGVIDAYRLARKDVPTLQLALVGAMTADDDYEAQEVLNSVHQYAGGDPDIHILYDPAVIGDLEVNAFQSGSDVIVQKSIREGFGLTVAEAMWKGTPVIGGNCGGIKLQINDGETGLLVNDAASCARSIVTLLNDRTLARSMGEAGRESVRRSFLMPRLLRDYLHVAISVLNGNGSSVHSQHQAAAPLIDN
ncbi:MAG: glycosyltransferase [Dehalococcoidales bacterium]|nr:MAG: glycosyltransferase [Dehalococcoidales bacterium]